MMFFPKEPCAVHDEGVEPDDDDVYYSKGQEPAAFLKPLMLFADSCVRSDSQEVFLSA